MPKATYDPTTSRRGILAALTGAAVAGGALVLAMPTDAPAGTITAPSSVLAGAAPSLRALYASWLDLERQANIVAERADAVRAELEARWGAIPSGVRAADHWGADPLQADLARLDKQSDVVTCAACDEFLALVAYPVTSLADIGLKVLALASQWALDAGNDTFHETTTAEFMRQASAFLTADTSVRA